MTGEPIEVTQADVTEADKTAVTRFHAVQIKRIMSGDKTLGDDRNTIEQAFAERRLAGIAEGRRLSAAKPEWRDIASAPTNRAVLVHVPASDYYGNEGVYAAMLVDMGTGKRWMTFAWACGRDLLADNQPDMWMPMPLPSAPGTPPTSEREGDWVLVPKEPTEAMVRAYYETPVHGLKSLAEMTWFSMLAASPNQERQRG